MRFVLHGSVLASMPLLLDPTSGAQLARDHEASVRDLPQADRGTHRELDRLATDTLRAAARRGQRVVDRALAAQVCEVDGVSGESGR